MRRELPKKAREMESDHAFEPAPSRTIRNASSNPPANRFAAVQTAESLDDPAKITVSQTNVLPAGTRTGLRPTARGKFIFVGDEKLYIRGVTYGTFRPLEDGSEYPAPETVERD